MPGDEAENSRIRIAIFSGFFFPHLGGQEKYVEELFCRLPTDDYIVDIYTANTEHVASFDKLGSFHIYRLNCWNILGGTFPIIKLDTLFWRTIFLFRRKEYHFCITQTRFFLSSFLGSLATIFSHTVHIHTEHGTSHPVLQSRITSSFAWLYDHTIGWFVIKHARHIIAISKASGVFAQHLGARKFDIVYNGVDTNLFQLPPVTDHLSVGPVNIVYVGRLIHAKGVQDLIAALKIITTDRSITLHIVGSGPDEELLVSQAQGLPNIFFHGQLPSNEVSQLLQTSLIFINPSFAEGLPTSVLEAVASGCIVIATDVGGTKEIFGSEYPWLIPPKSPIALAKAIDQVISTSQQQTKLIRQVQHDVRHRFSWQTISTSFNLLLKSYL